MGGDIVRNKQKMLLGVISVLILISLSACGGEKETIRIVEHEIINKNSHQTANAVRYSLDVLVKEEATEEELKALAEKIVEDFKKEEDFNALSIGFYDNAEDIGYGYTLGNIDYAPYGDWGRASEVGAGDYSKSEYSYSLNLDQ